MARSPRIFIPGAVYHVYCRTARGEMVFSNQKEATEFVEIVADVKQLHGFDLLAWCLMGNHYHLVIRSHDIPLWRSMARIQCRIARGHNRRRRILGRLWQSRYKARIVQDEVYYLQLQPYVHLNPVSAGIVDDPAKYRWSGHAALIGKRSPELIDIVPALEPFGSSGNVARRAYMEQVRLVAEARWIKSGVRDLPWWEDVKNDEKFIEQSGTANARDFRGNTLPSPSRRDPLDETARRFCLETGVAYGDLIGRTRSPEIASARRSFVFFAVNHLGHSVAEVATVMKKHPGSVSRWLGAS